MQLAAGELAPPIAPAGSLRLRIAGITLEVSSGHAPFLDELEGRYGDCMAAPTAAATLHCAASLANAGSFLALEFSGHALPDPFESAITPFRMLRHLRGEVVEGRPRPGWRALVRNGNADDVLLAGNSTRLLVRIEEATRDLAVDCLLAVALRAQPDLLFLHAASFAVEGRGGLLIGHGKSGKSSTVLALASRGHAFLGDDLAAVQSATAELLPFPKAAGLREGRQATEIQARARAFRAMSAIGLDGIPRKYVRVHDMFPGAASGVQPLDCVFLLDGFAAQARISPYEPSLQDIHRLRGVVSENVPGWGDSAGVDLVRFLRVVELLSRARCYLLVLGPLEESAMLIEHAMGNT